MQAKSLAAIAAGGALVALLGIAAPINAYAHMVQAPCDTVTSGGWMYDAHWPDWASFSFHGGCKNGDFWGEVNFVDHYNKFHLNSTRITGYLFDPQVPNARDICGFARVNDQSQEVMFRIRLVDNGEPGKRDMVGIVIDNWYSPQRFYVVPTSFIGDGNVQLHKSNNSTSASLAMLGKREWQMCGDLASP